MTDVDTYMDWRRPFRDERPDPEALRARLLRIEPPNEYLLRGRAFHRALERIEPGTAVRKLTELGWVFDFCLDGEVQVAVPAVRELRFEERVDVPGDFGTEQVVVVGKVDTIEGACVSDYKLMREFDAERLLSTYQWRLYLWMSGATMFRWIVFVGSHRPGTTHCRIRAVEELTALAYEGMEQDCRRALADYVAAVRSLGIEGQLDDSLKAQFSSRVEW